jgi:hypothetical protein
MIEKSNVQHVGPHFKRKSMEFAWYLSGFVDGAGCFSISFNKKAKMKTGIEIKPSFFIAQNKRNLQILKDIHAYFGCGAIRFNKYDQTYKYEVRSIKDLINIIIPHFQEYPLRTTKLKDFDTFNEICHLIIRSHHLNKEYLKQIIIDSYTMNEAGLRKYTKEDLLKILVR